MATARSNSGREIPWGELSELDLDDARRGRVGASWRSRAQQEHLAVGAFSMITTELAETGCDPVVLALVTRAASDEVRHAEVCGQLAQALLRADAPLRWRGLPRIPPWPEVTPRERALLHVVEMAAINETFTGLFLTEMRERATHPTVRGVIDSLLEDEIDHGRLGWAHAAASCRDGWGAATIGRALETMLVRTLTPVFRAAAEHPEPDDPRLEAHGYLGMDAAADLHRRGLRDVVLPGFERLDIDMRGARRALTDRGWLPSA